MTETTSAKSTIYFFNHSATRPPVHLPQPESEAWAARTRASPFVRELPTDRIPWYVFDGRTLAGQNSVDTRGYSPDPETRAEDTMAGRRVSTTTKQIVYSHIAPQTVGPFTKGEGDVVGAAAKKSNTEPKPSSRMTNTT